MSDCIMCGGESGGSEYAICAECCEKHTHNASELEVLHELAQKIPELVSEVIRKMPASERRLGKQCADCYANCDCSAEYFGDKCPCCAANENRHLQRPSEPAEWRITEKRSGAFAFAVSIVALLSFAAGVACGWLLL